MGFLSRASATAYNYFGWLGPLILKIFRSMPDQLKASGKGVFPEAYAALVGMLTLISAVASAALFLFLWLAMGVIMQLSAMVFTIPVITLLLLVVYPWLSTKALETALEAEIPYAAAYISVMAAGGISPYSSLQRIRSVKLMPKMTAVAGLLDVHVKARGVDPVSALEKIADELPSREFKELVQGYSATLRMGGDTTHYLVRRTEMIFSRQEAKVRAIAERMAMLAEAYLAVGILLALGLFIMFIISHALPLEVALFGVDTFLTVSYFILPFLSILFIYFADMLQPKYPTADYRPYRFVLFTFPIFLFSVMAFFMPTFIPQLTPLLWPFVSARDELVRLLGLERGFDAAFGIIIPLLILLVPAAIAEIIYSSTEKNILTGVTRFLREMVEVRKTGLTPERSIESLSRRKYGRFSKILRTVAGKIAWGTPYQKIHEYVQRSVRHWVSKVNLYILFDAIEVGGGTPETLEALARFSEQMETIEYAKRAGLRPLLIIPYIGAFVLIFAALVLLGFMKTSLLLAGRVLAFDAFLRLFLPPLVLNIAMMGLVAGKIAEERLAAGFKHSVLMILVTILAFVLSPHIAAFLTPPA